MKKVFVVGLLLAAAMAVFAGAKPEAEKKPRIGISKTVQHVALDACEQGILDALKTRGIDAVIDLQNANGDMSTASQIANKFKSERDDVVIGIATPVAQALANAIKDKPVVFSSVTDPVGAGLVGSLANGSGNVTGLSDAIPTGEHIALFQKLAGIKTLGYIYTSSEANSESARQLVQEACRNLGISLVEQSINTSADLRQAAQSIVNRVDGIYLTTDNTVFSALPALIDVFGTAKKPIFSGDVTGVRDGGAVFAAGFNYYKAGIATGNIVADILEGKQPGSIPVKLLTDPSELDFLIDLDAARNCGITIPPEYVTQANLIFENGKLTEK
ncbi:MAG: ABC transporter substrate-binding protein [Spirochaetaceae bacterium]|jgi:putative ABC transport system substrate-binding protein|nr:ABC transporter substrate-binding protein [Spirochaetaceae bacterium]